MSIEEVPDKAYHQHIPHEPDSGEPICTEEEIIGFFEKQITCIHNLIVIADEVEVRVMDSTADTRYLVIPVRPDGTEGWEEEALIPLVTRDSMIGVAFAQPSDSD